MQPNPPKSLESEVQEVAMRRNAEEKNTVKKIDRTNINRADERMRMAAADMLQNIMQCTNKIQRCPVACQLVA
jgi:hypothetical protein